MHQIAPFRQTPEAYVERAGRLNPPATATKPTGVGYPIILFTITSLRRAETRRTSNPRAALDSSAMLGAQGHIRTHAVRNSW